MQQVLITGANRGIGLALARHHVERGDRVHAVVRRVSPELRALGVALIDGVELTDAQAPAHVAAALADVMLDRAVLNAGRLEVEALDGFDAASATRVAEQFAVNALAPLRLAVALRARLARGAKLGLMTSRMGSIDDNGSGGYYGYRMSKAALNAAGRSLAHDLRDDGIAVFLLHPGYVRTDMTGGLGDRTPAQAAGALVECLDRLQFSQSGRFWHADGTPLPW